MVVTKVDGSAKGGAIFSVAKEGLPIIFVGSGEGPGDIAIFDPESFVDTLFGF